MAAKVDPFVQAIITKVVVGALVIILGYLLVIKPILVKVGIIDSAEDKKREKETAKYGASNDSPFSPNYYKNKPGVLLIKKEFAKELAAKIENAYGWFNDTETAIYGALRQLKAKTQLSFLAEVYYQEYGEDMYQKMREKLGDAELETVHSIVANLS